MKQQIFIHILHVCPLQGYKASEFSLTTKLKIKLLMNIIQKLIRSNDFKCKQKIEGPFKVFFANYIQWKTSLPPDKARSLNTSLLVFITTNFHVKQIITQMCISLQIVNYKSNSCFSLAQGTWIYLRNYLVNKKEKGSKFKNEHVSTYIYSK